MARLIASQDKIPYPQIRSKLRTGDLIFFEGDSAVDFAIEAIDLAAGEAPYSHVGMVINDGGNLYFWDAPGGGDLFPDPYHGDPNNRIHTLPSASHDGCRVAPLDPLLKYYSSLMPGQQFWVRQVSPPITAEQFIALRIFINRVDGLPFPTPVETALPVNFAAGLKSSTFFVGTYFCAQLVADSYLHMGLLSHDRYPANAYTPGSFSSDEPSVLPLVGPTALGPAINVVWQAPD